MMRECRTVQGELKGHRWALRHARSKSNCNGDPRAVRGHASGVLLAPSAVEQPCAWPDAKDAAHGEVGRDDAAAVQRVEAHRVALSSEIRLLRRLFAGRHGDGAALPQHLEDDGVRGHVHFQLCIAEGVLRAHQLAPTAHPKLPGDEQGGPRQRGDDPHELLVHLRSEVPEDPLQQQRFSQRRHRGRRWRRGRRSHLISGHGEGENGTWEAATEALNEGFSRERRRRI
eukprot:scaffold31_cov263-Pinguiococcus_pyrenoidosus.AAC.20